MPLTMSALRERLANRFEDIAFDRARDDVAPFLKDPREVRLWSGDFFRALIPQISVWQADRAGGS
jgi:hypothetical protein